MAQCPVCEAPISDEFGLQDCPSCSSPLFVQVDGSVEAANASEESDEVFGQEDEIVAQEYVAEAAPEEDGPIDFSSPEEDAPALPPPEPIPMFEPEAEPEPEPEAQSGMLFDEQDEAPAPMPGPSVSSSPDLSDIAHFGNSEASSHREGSLRYTLKIAGIDTADVREAFREALTDRKFMWDTDEILRGIRNGEVEIVNVAAVKAHVLITRLRTLPVRVVWEQYAIQQT